MAAHSVGASDSRFSTSRAPTLWRVMARDRVGLQVNLLLQSITTAREKFTLWVPISMTPRRMLYSSLFCAKRDSNRYWKHQRAWKPAYGLERMVARCLS